MWIVALEQLALIICLGAKDGYSYLLKDKNDTPLTRPRINRWHRLGAAIHFIATWMQAVEYSSYFIVDWNCVILAVLIRLSVFDPIFNKVGQIHPSGYIGGTARADKIFVFIFGRNGAYLKMWIFFGLTVAYIIINPLKYLN